MMWNVINKVLINNQNPIDKGDSVRQRNLIEQIINIKEIIILGVINKIYKDPQQ